MMNQFAPVPYVFVVDTNSYAGNFERELVAYMTGARGDCRVGKTEAKYYEEDMGELGVALTAKLGQYPDDNECYRPATIWPTPNRYNDGDGNHFDGPGRFPAYESVAALFDECPTPEEIDLMKRRAQQYCALAAQGEFSDYHKHEIKIKGFRLITQTVVTKEIIIPAVIETKEQNL